MAYTERASVIPGAVVWQSVADTSELVRVLPDGCMDLLWDGTSLSVAGPDTVAKVHRPAPGSVITGLRFAPGFAPLVLGVPAVAFVDQRPDLDAVWSGAEVQRHADTVASVADAGRALEVVALGRRPAHADRLIGEVVVMVGRGEQVAAVARQVGLSERQLHRRSLAAFGYGAKTLGRILRLQRALTMVRAGTSAADAAAAGGYADQPHLARDAQSLAGASLGELVS